MASAFYEILLWLPFLLVMIAGWLCGKSKSRMLTVLIAVVLCVYPISHWHLLRFYRNRFLTLNFKDEAVWSAVTSYMVFVEIPACVLIFALFWWLGRRHTKKGKGV